MAAEHLCPLTPHVLKMQELDFVLYPLYFMVHVLEVHNCINIDV